MTVIMNILAVALMVLVPFLRPCSCSSYTFFCDCRAGQAAEHDGCCGSGCRVPTQDQDHPEHAHAEKSEPCGQLFVTEFGMVVQFMDSVSGTATNGFVWLRTAARSQVAGSFRPTFDYHPPPSFGVMVSQTQFLRI